MQDFNFYNVTNSEGLDYLNKSFARSMIRYAPNGQAPLYGLTSMLGEGKALSVEHGYFSKTMLFPKVTINNGAGYLAGDTTFTVDDTSEVVPGELLRSPAGEIIRVTTVASGTSITVLRAVGQVAAAALSDNDILYSIGNAHEQGSVRPTSRLMNPVRVMNNTQIWRDSWALPKTMSVIRPIVGDTLVGESREDCGMFHAAGIERTMFFGQKSGQIVNGQYLTTMDGLIETVRRLAPAGNTTTAGATTTYDELETALDPCFNTITDARQGNERVLFVGGSALKVINNIGRLSGQYQIIDGQTSFGLQFKTFKIARGSFRMIEHPQFNSNPTWSRMAIAVDLPSIKVMNLRPTENLEYGMNGTPVDNGIDAVGGTLTTELTMENVNPSAHAVIFGLTAAAS